MITLRQAALDPIACARANRKYSLAFTVILLVLIALLHPGTRNLRKYSKEVRLSCCMNPTPVEGVSNTRLGLCRLAMPSLTLLTPQQSQRKPLNGMLFMRSTPKNWLQQRCVINCAAWPSVAHARHSTMVHHWPHHAEKAWHMYAHLNASLYRM